MLLANLLEPSSKMEVRQLEGGEPESGDLLKKIDMQLNCVLCCKCGRNFPSDRTGAKRPEGTQDEEAPLPSLCGTRKNHHLSDRSIALLA